MKKEKKLSVKINHNSLLSDLEMWPLLRLPHMHMVYFKDQEKTQNHNNEISTKVKGFRLQKH